MSLLFVLPRLLVTNHEVTANIVELLITTGQWHRPPGKTTIADFLVAYVMEKYISSLPRFGLL